MKSRGALLIVLYLKNSIDLTVIQSVCCKRAYLRGAFLGSGSVSDPEKGYHLEFVNQTEKQSLFLKEIMESAVSLKVKMIVDVEEGKTWDLK